MQKRVFIIHGWEANPGCNWFPWLKAELEHRGFEVFVPAMPNTLFPKPEEWLSHMKKIIGKPDRDTFLVGHSLGVIAILRCLESLGPFEKVGGALLVAGPDESIGFPEIEAFFHPPVDYAAVKAAAGAIAIINSDTDPYIPLSFGKRMSKKLGAKLVVLHSRGHLNCESDNFMFPEALDEILLLSK
ncbi:Serine hydrolase [uncultured archaeon]|nr:Serine hydrolase [uncultured archaeon]